MNTIERTVIHRIIGPTNNIIDRYKRIAAINFGEKRGCRDEAIQIVLEDRLEWLNWLSITQCRWQKETKNPNKARHSDSITIREKYVQCKI